MLTYSENMDGFGVVFGVCVWTGDMGDTCTET